MSASQLSYHNVKNSNFPIPSRLQDRVDFWKKIYSFYTTDQVVIHDENYLNIIYEVVDLKKLFSKKKPSERQKRRRVKAIKKKYRIFVKNILKKRRKGIHLTYDEQRIYNMLVKAYPPKKLHLAYRHIRGQLGQKDRFLKGLKRSGRYIKKMEAIFKSFELPVELTVLPHVESSFNVKAYSRFGAAGIWQFTRSTGRRFLKINYEIDDRRDPIKSTVAAAKLLKENFEGLRSWPLAITAYNHGYRGMKRAQRIVGNDISDVIENYKARTFGFASKNFYSEFLAALQVVKDYKRYFGSIQFDKSFEYNALKLDHFLDIETLSRYLNLFKETIRLYNPSLRPAIFESNKYIPRGYNLRLPKGRLNRIKAAYASIPKDKKFSRQKRLSWYKVKRGDTLSTIARRLRTQIGSLRRLNNIRNSHRIYVGQILQVPSRSYSKKRDHSVNNFKKPVKIAALNKKRGIVSSNKSKKGSKKGVLKKSSVNRGKSLTYNIGKQPSDMLINALSVRNFTPVSAGSSSAGGGLFFWVTVEPDETLGHYSDWSNVSTRTLRKLNNLSFRETIKIGQKVKLSFEKSTLQEFETRRREYHRGIEEDFFSNFYVEKVVAHTLRRGDTLWDIFRDNQIPYWLLKGYNADKDLSTLMAGDVLSLPIIAETRE